MSIGNVKTIGSKGNNWTWQYAVLKTLNSISSSLGTSTEFESRLVRLIASPYTLYLEVRLWDIDTSDWSGNPKYYEVGSNTPVTPPSAVQYADEDNALVLDAIKTATETTATETTSIDTSNAAILAMNTDILAKNTEIEVDTTAIATSTAGIEGNTDPVTGITPALLRPTTSGSVSAGARSVSIANVGAESGTVLGIELAAGETVTFDAGSLNNTLAAVTYDPTTPGAGTTFLIATLT